MKDLRSMEFGLPRTQGPSARSDRETSSFVRASRRGPPHTCFLAKLRSLSKLSTASEELISGLNLVDSYMAGQTVRLADGARPFAISDGWAAYYRLLSDGRRQIVSILLPGDHYGLHDHDNAFANLSLIALTRLDLLNAAPVRAAVRTRGAEHAGLIDALRRAEAQEINRLINHIVRLGRQSALERTAHLLAEIYNRLSVVGRSEQDRFPMPLTQESLADILGLSIVHVNRTLHQLKAQRLLTTGHGSVRILDAAAMAEISDFSSDVRAPETCEEL